MVMESYADAPVSVAERRADLLGDQRKWTPRDALISVLRDIDSGKLNCTDIVIVVREPTEGDHRTGYYIASPIGGALTLGMLARASHMINAMSD